MSSVMTPADPWKTTVSAPNSGGAFEVPPAGNPKARICALIDVGHLPETNDKGESYDSRKLIVGFELSKKKADGKPFVIANRYTFSMRTNSHLYSLVRDVLSRTLGEGAEFDPRELLSRYCRVQINHKDGTTQKGEKRVYANVGSVTALDEDDGKFEASIEPVLWSVRQGTPPPCDLGFLGRIYGQTVYDMIRDSVEYRNGSVPGIPSDARPNRVSEGQPQPATPAAPRPAAAPGGVAADDEIPF